MRMLADDDDEVLSTTAAKSQTSQQPAWMRTLLERCREWLDQLPAVWTTYCLLPLVTECFFPDI
jgi:dynein heavy chain 1, cytosolic